LLAIGDTGCIQRSTDDVVTHTGEILHAAATNEHDGVLLEVMADAWDIRGDLDAVGKPDAGYFTERRIGLLGG